MATVTTERGEETRRRIIESAARAFAAHGYAGTSLTDVLHGAGVTKGGFYFHFPSKARLALDVIEWKRGEWMRSVLAAAGEHERASHQVVAIMHALAEHKERDRGVQVVARLCQELADVPEVAGEIRHFQGWLETTEELLRTRASSGGHRPRRRPRGGVPLRGRGVRRRGPARRRLRAPAARRRRRPRRVHPAGHRPADDLTDPLPFFGVDPTDQSVFEGGIPRMLSALSPATLARASARRPWRVVAIWGVLLVASIAVVAVALSSALTTETSFVNSPESKRASDTIEQRLGAPAPVVESVIVSSPSRTVDDPAVRQAVGDARRPRPRARPVERQRRRDALAGRRRRARRPRPARGDRRGHDDRDDRQGQRARLEGARPREGAGRPRRPRRARRRTGVDRPRRPEGRRDATSSDAARRSASRSRS